VRFGVPNVRVERTHDASESCGLDDGDTLLVSSVRRNSRQFLNCANDITENIDERSQRLTVAAIRAVSTSLRQPDSAFTVATPAS
jgi:hypothetical protein